MKFVEGEKHSPTRYLENIFPVKIPKGTRSMYSPFCDFVVEFKSPERDLEIVSHIEKKHPEIIDRFWIHGKSERKYQKILEDFA
ncbi:hypothetical protein [Caldiplasma sukawensis]